jgi:hypothetical protein
MAETPGGLADVEAKRPKTKRFSLRSGLRAVHRDLGYVLVGLTVIYAASGLAVNHIADWDPSFEAFERTHELGPLTGDDAAIVRDVTTRLGIAGPVRDTYRASESELEVTLDKRTLVIDTKTGSVRDEGQEPRFFLRLANWLHLNRGKKAWTVVADTYAVGLLVLAVSGLFMLGGRKGLVGRGGVLLLLGAGVPIAYVVWSGGPEAETKAAPPSATLPAP